MKTMRYLLSFDDGILSRRVSHVPTFQTKYTVMLVPTIWKYVNVYSENYIHMHVSYISQNIFVRFSVFYKLPDNAALRFVQGYDNCNVCT